MSEPKSTIGQAVQQNRLYTPPNSSPPPTYSRNDDNAVPDITAAFANLDLKAARKPVPTTDQCIAHLKLLEAFHQLREDIALTDGLYGIQDAFAPSTRDERKRSEVLTKIREKRWAVYVAKAAKRFESWWELAVQSDAQKLKQNDIGAALKRSINVGPFIAIDRNHLPPLDVVMVWHAYQLNPRDFLEDCLRYGKMDFWRTGFPWAAVNSCIDNESLEYCPGDKAMDYFENRTGLSWGSFNEPSEAQVKCPMCNKIHCVPWTTWDQKSAWEDDIVDSKQSLRGGLIGIGLADKNFSFQSPCGIIINHDLLKTQKFRKDMEALRFADIPMPGTLLSSNGLPEAPLDRRHKPLFPNRLIYGPNGRPSTAYTLIKSTTTVRQGTNRSMSDVRADLERAISDHSSVRKANHTLTSTMAREEKVSIRRMMSHYWDNSTPFGLDLIGAVIRQGSFIEKMHSIDWVHSPTLRSTMTRFLTRYDRFITILSTNPTQTAVPTLDIDLVWHTHQLSPPSYYTHTVAQTGNFINHDDKIDETALSTAFEWTSKTYQKMFRELYSECTCWYCESIRESHTGNGLSRLFNNNTSTTITTQLSRLHPPSSPHSTPHISAHNAIKAPTDKDRALQSRVLQLKLETSYRAALHRARKDGRESPRRDEYMYAYAYGYPLYLPYYAPYMGDPCTEGMYASNPSCANFQTGAVGNCCQGACGGGVAAGSCGGGGSGGCVGGAAGGCGGGGGGGGGCGGGGGGGGCGGGGG